MAISGRVLVADDEEGFLRATCELLRREGFDCDGACDAIIAKEMLSLKEYDLLVADIRMPGNLKMEFVKEVPEIAKGIPIIMVTAYPSLDSAIQAVELPVVAYLIKPFDFQEFKEHVCTAVAHHQAFRSVRKTQERLTNWQQDLTSIEQLLAQSDASVRSASVDALVALTLTNIVGSLSNLRQLFQSLRMDEPDGKATRLLTSPQVDALTDLIRETVNVLEKTKSAFKSKDLGELRRRLERILQEAEAPGPP